MREFTYIKYFSSRLCQKSSQSRTPNVLRSCGRIDVVTMRRYVLEAILFIVLQKCIAAQGSSICAHNLTFSVRWAPNSFHRKGFPSHNHLSKFTLILLTRQYSSTGGTRQRCIYREFRVLPFGKQAANRYCLVGRSLSRR